MDANHPVIVTLKEKINAAREELDLATAFREAWKPTAFDSELIDRMGTSFATHTFHVVRASLRRETLLALMRLWDKGQRDVGMEAIGRTIRKPAVLEAIAQDRASRLPKGGLAIVRESMAEQGAAAAALIDKYSRGGSHWNIRDQLQAFRHERLAHRQTVAAEVVRGETSADEVETFYQDMSQLIQLLMKMALATHYEPDDTAGIYRFYAKFFWQAARGERTDGHPSYRPIPDFKQIMDSKP